MVPCLVTLINLLTRRAGLSASAELLVLNTVYTDPADDVSQVGLQQQWWNAVVLLEVVSLGNVFLLVHRHVGMCIAKPFVQLSYTNILYFDCRIYIHYTLEQNLLADLYVYKYATNEWMNESVLKLDEQLPHMK